MIGLSMQTTAYVDSAYYKKFYGQVTNQADLVPNGLQLQLIGNTGNNFDGDLANKTFEGTFANFNGAGDSSKNIGFTLAGATSTNQGIYYKTWYSGYSNSI